YQVLGRDGVPERLLIDAQNPGALFGNLVLTVSASQAAGLNGQYYTAPMANIKSLTIRGSQLDSERLRIGNDVSIETQQATKQLRSIEEVQIFDGALIAVSNYAVPEVWISGLFSVLGGPETVDVTTGLLWTEGTMSGVGTTRL